LLYADQRITLSNS